MPRSSVGCSAVGEDRVFTYVPSDQVAAWWPRVVHLFDAVCEVGRGDVDPEWIRQEAEAGRAQLWIVVAPHRVVSACATKVILWPQTKVCQVFSLAGRLDECLPYLPVLEEWARGLDCTHVTARGRQGWVRVLAPHGYSPSEWEVEKRL